jgi:catecholate siderophore receptor
MLGETTMYSRLMSTGVLLSRFELSVKSSALLSVSILTLMSGSVDGVMAQDASSSLPAIRVDAPRQVQRAPVRASRSTSRQQVVRRAPRVRAEPVQQTSAPVAAPAASFNQTQDARTGTVGVYSNSTSVATKTSTPLVDIPQSLSVLTKDFIRDQAVRGLTDVTRYVPGVAVHQGEGNRDELVIRGVGSSANFFVNGFRDDVQFYRDLYNVQSVEVLKGPGALTFGRGVGGGLLNRTLKEADGTRVREITAQTGAYANRRVSLDVGDAINDTFAARLNAVYEKSETFRRFGELERYGINPTVTWRPDAATKVTLGYEYFHDERTTDRGNPSQALSAVAPASTRFNPASPFAPFGDITAFYGSPTYNFARASVNSVSNSVEHDFGNGFTVRNATLIASYQKFYQNVFPGGGALSGAVNPAGAAFNRAAYNNTTNRDNAFNQTDITYKTATGPIAHTLVVGAEFGRQTGVSLRNTGLFPNGTSTIVGDPLNPTYYGTVNFTHLSTDANSQYRLNTQSVYARDTIDVTRWLQFIAGARFDRFDMSANDRNTNILRARVDDNVSPQAAVIIKPWENVSIYGSYMTSFLPASGDQFSALSNGTLILAPQKFVNTEVGVKWNINPKLLYSAAVYNLDRTNVPLADPGNPGFFLLSGKNRVRGVDTSLTGFVTDDWQVTLGYAYTDARIESATSATVVAGNRVQLVPLNQVSLWNKYQFSSVWAASVGVIYFSDSFASSDNTVRLPGFVRFDAGVFAKINENWRAQLNVENIFNKGYWATADGNNNLGPGQPRTMRVSLTASF